MIDVHWDIYAYFHITPVNSWCENLKRVIQSNLDLSRCTHIALKHHVIILKGVFDGEPERQAFDWLVKCGEAPEMDRHKFIRTGFRVIRKKLYSLNFASELVIHAKVDFS